MGFFTDVELEHLRIERMNFQVVGEEHFVQRPAMRTVEQPEFFLGRIIEIDVGAAFSFEETSTTKSTVERIATGATGFANAAVALARDFDGRHVGQSKPGAFFFFELSVGNPGTRVFAMLKYDYSEVLTLRRNDGNEQLRRIVQAFVKDKRALQKSALVRVVGAVAEEMISVKDRAARSPDITDFFSGFLGVQRTRDAVELNRDALTAVGEIARSAPDGTWPQGEAVAVRAMREALRTCPEISVEVMHNIVFVAAGRPGGEDEVESLHALTERVWRRKRLSGLAFPPDATVFRVASSRKVKTVENIRIEYPESLDGVAVMTELRQGGGATITIQTARIESNEIVNESLSSIRRLTN